MFSAPQPLTRNQIRHYYRQLRLNLTPAQQQQHAVQLAEQFKRFALFQQSQHIAVYAAYQGEIDPIALVQFAWQQGKICYLPVLQSADHKTLLFAPFTPDTKLKKNRLHIQEPETPKQLYSASNMDLILVPLVVFDLQGNRLGMGGGYYDQTLSFLDSKSLAKPPYVMGLAHELQKIQQLTAYRWDIPLHAVATEKTIYSFS